MNQKETKEISERISPLERKRIEAHKRLTVEEIYVLKRRGDYFNITQAIIMFFFVLQLPLKTLVIAIRDYTFPSSGMIFVSALFGQAMTLFMLVFFVLVYCYFIDYFLGFHYFRKGKEIIKKLRNNN